MNIALIGTGGMGSNHVEAYQYCKDITVLAVADVDFESARKYSKKLNCNAYCSLDEVLENERPDAVDICVPSFLHAEYSLKCLKRGIHVFCEKPMAHSVEDADRMLEAARKSGAKLMVGQVLRYWPEYQFLKRCIDNKPYGTLRYLSLTRQYGMHPKGSWYMNPELCKMVCYEMHIHDTDMVNYLFGLPDALHSIGCEQPDIHMSYINTHYIYNGADFAVVAQGGWNDSSLPWAGGYLAAFEHGTVAYKDGVVTCYPAEEKPFPAKLETLEGVPSEIVGVYQELTEFVDLVAGRVEMTGVTPKSARDTIYLVGMECQSLMSASVMALK